MAKTKDIGSLKKTEYSDSLAVVVTDANGHGRALNITDIPGSGGSSGGATGATFVPSVDATTGDISWTNDKGLTNPETVNIKGPAGPAGAAGEDGATYTPLVADNGDISWINDKGLANPTTVNVKGPKGDKGDQGIQGPTGKDGTSFVIAASYNTADEMQADTTIADGNIVAVVTDANAYAYLKSSGYVASAALDYAGFKYLFDIGKATVIKGDKGDTGAQGPKGDKGDKGDTGAIGPQGAQGPKGDKGDAGPAGAQGPTGPAGAQGAIGPQGPKGDAGTDGLKGDKGDKGDTGAAGANGVTFTPAVDASGNLSWTNDGNLTNPTAVNIKGPKGDTPTFTLEVDADGNLWLVTPD